MKDLIKTLLYHIFCLIPIKKNKIICCNFYDKGFGDSPKYIVKELLKEKNKYDIVWVCRKEGELSLPNGVRSSRGIKALYEYATAKIWISNVRMPLYLKKRKKQLYIQTWHGSICIKKIEYDVIDKLSNKYIKMMKQDNKQIDLILSNNNLMNNIFKTGFKYDGKIFTDGLPRNDLFFENHSTYINKIKKHYNIKEESILLYAPTFRNTNDYNPYDIDYKKLKNVLEKSTKKSWKILARLHPNMANESHKYIDTSVCVDASDYPDLQELMCACDVLITDYSSIMFEAMIANKPVLLYCSDIDEYLDDRGFYFSIKDLPFPLLYKNSELIDYINHNDVYSIIKKYNKLKKEIGLKESGKSSKKIVKIINDEIF